MKKITLIFLLFISTISSSMSQKFPLVTDTYDLTLSVDFKEKSLSGISKITIHNRSDSTIQEIPFLLYRLMKIEYVSNSEGQAINFRQSVVSFEDFPFLQANSIVVSETIQPSEHKTIYLKYNGYLLGYSETGMRYIKDRISPEFTLIRNDAFAYPLIGKPSFQFLRQNIAHDFNYNIQVAVPDSLVVANGGVLLGKEVQESRATYSYKSKKPNWRIDIAIAPYKKLQSIPLDIYYYGDSLSAVNITNHGTDAFSLYESWWGKLKNNNTITIIETEKGSGGQADETTILLPQEAFADKDNYEYLFHEISHLWNVHIREVEGVSPRWEEGLATFCQFLATEKLYPERSNYLKNNANNNIKWLKRSMERNNTLLTVPMIDFGNKNLTNYSYQQGMIMFTVLYYWFGEEKFNQVIRQFYQSYHNTGATTQDFTNLWSKITKSKGIQRFFDDWVYKTDYTRLILADMNIENIISHYVNDRK